jgi:hypothetical protein
MQAHCGFILVRRSVNSRFTRDGDHIPSGNRDPDTGITPMDNFVCWRCQREGARSIHADGQASREMADERQMDLALAPG